MSLVDVNNKKLLSLLLLVSFVSIVSCGHVDEETPRSYVRLLSADTLTERRQIEVKLLSGGTIVPHDLKLTNSQGLAVANISYGRVTSGGVIIAYSDERKTLVVFEPSINDDHVLWRCDVRPVSAKPKECGEWH